MYRLTKHLPLAALLILLTACSDDEPGDVYKAEPFSTTVILEQDALTALRASEADGTLRFTGTPAALASIAAGQVLVGSASTAEPRGLLRFVGAVEHDAQGLVLRTTEAPVQLAFRKLEVRFQRHVGEKDQPLELVKSKQMALTETISGGYWPPLDVDEYAFNGDGDTSTPLDQVHVTGKLSGGINYVFTLSVDWGAVDALPSAVTECVKKFFKGSINCSLQALMPEAKITFNFKAGADAELGLEGVAFLGYEREFEVGSKELDEVPIGPLVFFPEVQIVARVTGEASSQFRLSTKANVSAETTISYSNKSGGSFTPPALTKSFEAPSVEAALTAKSSVAIGPRLVITLYDIAGIYGSLYAVAEVDADQNNTPCWRLTGGLDGDAGFLIKSPDLPLLGHVTLAKFGKTFGIASEEIASGSCKIPDVVGPTPTGGEPDLAAFTSPDFTPWGAAYPDVVDGFPHEGLGAQVEWSQVTPTIDGRFILSSSDSRVLLKLDTDGKVVWARRYEADVSFFKDTLKPDLLPGRVVSAGDGTLWVVAHPYTLLKVAASGGLWWARRFDVPYKETWLRFTDAVDDGAGGLFVVGTYAADDSNPLDDADGWLLRLDKSGQVTWSVRFGDSDRAEIPRRLVRLPDGVAVVGQLWDPGISRWRGLVARFTDQGKLSWARQIVADDCGGGNEQWLYPTTGLRSRDGDLILGAGVMHSGYQLAVMKVKLDGTLSWYQLSGATESSHLGPVLTDLVQLPTSGYLAAGVYSGQATAQDVWLAGLDSVGKVQWARAYGGTQNPSDPLLTDDTYPALLSTLDGGVVLGAHSEALVSQQHSMWAIKVPAKDGAISFNGKTSAQQTTLGLAPASDTCLTGSSWSPATASLAATPAALTVKVHKESVQATVLAP